MARANAELRSSIQIWTVVNLDRELAPIPSDAGFVAIPLCAAALSDIGSAIHQVKSAILTRFALVPGR